MRISWYKKAEACRTLASFGMASHPLPRSPVSQDEILTLPELAKLLKVAEKTVYTMAQGAEVPGFKVRGQWRFRRRDIDEWIADQLRRSQPRRARPTVAQAVPRKAAR
jgi:excisionase family DNA binding protein